MTGDHPPDQDPIEPPHERASRTNLLLSAMIDGTARGPVRIRNLSSSGAMLEGAALPPVGERLTLRRADLEVGATVAWQTGGRCGVRFDCAVSVASWSAPSRTNAANQARVDSIQTDIRRGVSFPAPGATREPPRPIEQLDQRLAEELAFVGRLLDSMADELADDPAVVQRHAATLQGFDMACQILGHLGTILTADDRTEAVGKVGMEELRVRLSRKPIF